MMIPFCRDGSRGCLQWPPPRCWDRSCLAHGASCSLPANAASAPHGPRIHLMFEQQAAEILGIDYAKFTQCALITCGYTMGTDFKPATGPPIETVLHWDNWGGQAPWV